MKIFRLARAELNKLFQRPAIFLMAGFFKPRKISQQKTYIFDQEAF